MRMGPSFSSAAGGDDLGGTPTNPSTGAGSYASMAGGMGAGTFATA